MTKVQERGPWTVSASSRKVWVASEDFTHDVSMEVHGDFEDDEQKKAYAEEICRRLNALLSQGVPATEPAPAGWKLVPIEPTALMVQVAREAESVMCSGPDIYRAMLAAAPDSKGETQT